MGRTLPTATMLLQNEEASWSHFRRALRKEDQEILDDLFRKAKMQLPAISYQVRPIPFESVLMAILIAQQQQLNMIMAILKESPGESHDHHGLAV